MHTFLFLALRTPELTARVVRAASRTSATVILDLEDSLWDATDPGRTAALKAVGRETLVTLARERPALFASQRIGVRVNRVSGPEAAADLDAVERASAFVELECVVLPKVQDEADLRAYGDAVGRGRVASRGIVPIVETRVAMANLDRVLAAAQRAGIEWVIYGHYDLGLDSGWWPIPEHHDPGFWDRVVPLIRRIEDAGMGYVHPPYLHTHDDEGLLRVLGRLPELCRREFGLLAIGLGQAAVAARFAEGTAPAAGSGVPEAVAARSAPRDSAPDLLELADRVVATYEGNQRPDAGFALDRHSGEFVAPHAYLAARRYLARAGRG